MRTNLICRLVILCVSLWVSSAGAEQQSHAVFQYKAGSLGNLDQNNVYSAWNPNDPAAVLKPGMKVMFFGRAVGCDSRAANGPVTDKGDPRFGQASELTGVPTAPEGKGGRWAPSADTKQCPEAARNQVGDSFVHVNEDQATGGIGIFTFTGPDEKGRRSFFRQFDSGGKNGTGANANIEGTFVAFRFNWQQSGAAGPWAGEGGDTDKRTAEFMTEQSVAAVSAGGNPARSGDPVQAKQQMIVALINPDCFHAKDTKKGMCQIQYLFNVAVVRAGINDWDNVAWFKSAGLMLDPAQGGMPVVHGPIGREGETVVDDGSRLELYTSMGDPSQHGKFQDKTFRMRVSFAQFKNALKIVAGKMLKKSPQQVSPEDLTGLIGGHWDDPSQWVLLSVNVSQEVFNPFDGTKAFIGGAIKEISIGRAPNS